MNNVSLSISPDQISEPNRSRRESLIERCPSEYFNELYENKPDLIKALASAAQISKDIVLELTEEAKKSAQAYIQISKSLTDDFGDDIPL